MNKIIKALSLFYLCLILACNRCPDEHLDIDCQLHLDFELISEQSISDFFEKISNIRFINLDDSIPINEISGIKQFGNNTFIVEKRQKKLICYDSIGNLKFCLNRQGRGPEDYLDLTDFAISRSEIFILDRIGNKILTYKIDDGKCNEVVNLNKRIDFKSIGIYQDSIFVLTAKGAFFNLTGENCYIYFFDKNGKIINRLHTMPDYYNRRIKEYSFNHTVQINGDTILLTLPLDNKIYRIVNNKSAVKWYFDFGHGHNIDEFIRDNTKLSGKDFSSSIRSQNIYRFKEHVFETDRNILAPLIMKNGVSGLLFLDKATKEFELFRYTYSEIYELMGIDSPIYHLQADDFCTTIHPALIFDKLELYDLKDIPESNLRYVYEYLKDQRFTQNSNPVIMTFNLNN